MQIKIKFGIQDADIRHVAIHPTEVLPSRTAYGWRVMVEGDRLWADEIEFLLARPGHAGIIVDVTWQAVRRHQERFLAAGYSVCTENKLIANAGTDTVSVIGGPSFIEGSTPSRWNVNAYDADEIGEACPDLRWQSSILPHFPQTSGNWQAEYERWIVAAEAMRGLK